MISLQKGQKISLTKDNPRLNEIIVGLGWDAVKKGFFFFNTDDVDVDATAFALRNGIFTQNRKDECSYRNKIAVGGSIKHTGDNLTGEGEGDDEQIIVKLQEVPNEIDKIVVVVNIYNCINRKQHFGQIKNAYIRIINKQNNQELCRFNLSEDYNNMTAVVCAELYRHDGEWKFNPIGQGTKDTSIDELETRYK